MFKKVFTYAGLAVAGGLAIYISSGYWLAVSERNSLRTKVAQLESDYTQCVANNKIHASNVALLTATNESLNLVVDEQNKSIRGLIEEKTAFGQEIQLLEDQLKEVSKEAEADRESILNEVVSNDCQSSLDWIKQKFLDGGL